MTPEPVRLPEMSESEGADERRDRVAAIVTHTTRLYSNIVDWYVENFFDDLTDKAWLEVFGCHLRRGSLVLDVGAGPGNFARVLQLMGLRVVASDLAWPMVAASRRLVPEVAAAIADMRHLPFADEVADGLLCAYSLAHIPASATPSVLAEFSRVLRPRGVLQLMIKSGSGSYEFESTLVAGARGFVQLWNVDQMTGLLTEAGFDSVDCDTADASSPHELDHPKFMLLARKRAGRRV